MKTLKKIHTLLAMIAICLCFTSCSKDDDDNGGDSEASSLIGSWYDEGDDYYEKITFKKNGTVIFYYEEYYGGRWEKDREEGTYSVKGNKLTVYIGDDVETATFKVTSKKLTIEDEDGDTFVYYRIEEDD